MELKDCIEFANMNPVSYIATVDGDKPRVKGLILWYADEIRKSKVLDNDS